MDCFKVRIGRVLINHNLITKEQLEECLAYQERNGGLIGQILTAKCFVSALDLEEGLKFQKERVCPIAR